MGYGQRVRRKKVKEPQIIFLFQPATAVAHTDHMNYNDCKRTVTKDGVLNKPDGLCCYDMNYLELRHQVTLSSFGSLSY